MSSMPGAMQAGDRRESVMPNGSPALSTDPLSAAVGAPAGLTGSRSFKPQRHSVIGTVGGDPINPQERLLKRRHTVAQRPSGVLDGGPSLTRAQSVAMLRGDEISVSKQVEGVADAVAKPFDSFKSKLVGEVAARPRGGSCQGGSLIAAAGQGACSSVLAAAGVTGGAVLAAAGAGSHGSLLLSGSRARC
jgi:hypothetical protein